MIFVSREPFQVAESKDRGKIQRRLGDSKARQRCYAYIQFCFSQPYSFHKLVQNIGHPLPRWRTYERSIRSYAMLLRFTHVPSTKCGLSLQGADSNTDSPIFYDPSHDQPSPTQLYNFIFFPHSFPTEIAIARCFSKPIFKQRL